MPSSSHFQKQFKDVLTVLEFKVNPEIEARAGTLNT